MYAPIMFNSQSQFTPLYNNARGQARLNKLRALLQGRSSRLLDLNEIVNGAQIVSRHYLGTYSVPVNQIKGSESRNQDFDSEFNPVRDNNKERWINIIAARLFEKGLPAIDLIKINETYFVRDGHHRVSVARALGAVYIDAHVTELTLG